MKGRERGRSVGEGRERGRSVGEGREGGGRKEDTILSKLLEL